MQQTDGDWSLEKRQVDEVHKDVCQLVSACVEHVAGDCICSSSFAGGVSGFSLQQFGLLGHPADPANLF